jgi:hypothetical protein
MGIVNEDGSSKKDVIHLDLAIRNQDTIGNMYFFHLEFNNDEWDNGEIYNSRTGKMRNCYIELEGKKFQFTGYIDEKWLG